MFKRTRVVTALVLLLVALALPVLAAEEENRFKSLSKDANSTYFLDVKTLRHVAVDSGYDFRRNPDQVSKDKGYVEAWVKVEYSKQGAKEVVASLVAQERVVEGYDRLAFSFQLLRVRPATRELALLEQADYDKTGKLLGHSIHPADRWVSYQAVDARAVEICEKLVAEQKIMYVTTDR